MNQIKRVNKYLRDLRKVYSRFFSRVFSGVALMLAVMPPLVYLMVWILERFFGVDFKIVPEGTLGQFWYSWKELAWMYLFVGIQEEGLFRLLIQDCIFERFLEFPKWMSLGIAAGLFGAAHLWNPGGVPYTIPQAVGAAGAGIVLGKIYRRWGLHYAIIIHGGYDWVVTMIPRWFG